MKRVMVTGIGGVVGQGILKNIRSEYSDIFLVGVNVSAVSAGNHLCDKFYIVPFGDAPGYIDEINHIVRTASIDLIIPSTDLESFILGKNKNQIRAHIATSSTEATQLSLDKYETFLALSKHSIPFAPSCLPSDYKGQWDQIIVKPRQGRGSRGIHINPKELSLFDDSFLVQDLLAGEEITSACYVTKSNEIHSLITFARELESGNTSKAEVTFEYDRELRMIFDNLKNKFKLRGSFNLQSIVSKKGIIPFEINCRISGTNSIRPHFGFKDIKWTLQEGLFDQVPDKAEITRGSAIRVINDIIYPEKQLHEIADRNDKFYLR